MVVAREEFFGFSNESGFRAHTKMNSSGYEGGTNESVF
jgi:hypothetical protein